MKVICQNDKGRPDEIPANKWVKKGEPYTVINAFKCMSQPGQPLAYELAEINIKGCGAYEGFGAWRFSIPEIDDLLQAETANKTIL
jgi:hypothetical protein